jgi:hypothetical protein
MSKIGSQIRSSTPPLGASQANSFEPVALHAESHEFGAVGSPGTPQAPVLHVPPPQFAGPVQGPPMFVPLRHAPQIAWFPPPVHGVPTCGPFMQRRPPHVVPPTGVQSALVRHGVLAALSQVSQKH